ncbi:MAG: hypothetical protein JST31_14710 [Actinobacteria bacterium]|nr:hypothetical protein [Actinomycetota bacterium]
MRQGVRRSLSFSNVVAVVALFFALGGTVYAAGKISGSQIKPNSIPANRIKSKSISASQIKPGTISGAQIQAGSISASQVKSGSLTGAQIQAGSLTGAQVNGATLTGVSAAAIGTVQYVTATVAINAASESGTSGTANCPSGTKVIGGGATVSDPIRAYVNESAPALSRTGWFADGVSSEPGVSMTVTAICTPVTTANG